MTATAASRNTSRGGRAVVGLGRRLANVSVIGPIVVFVVVVGLWQLGLFHAVFGLKTFTVPYPSAMVADAGKHAPELAEALLESVPPAILGYLSGIAIGFLVASVIMLAAPRLANTIVPLLASVNAVPIAAIAPLLVLWFGVGLHLKVLVVVVITTPTVVVYTMRGFTSVEPAALELLASYEASARTIFRTLRVPSAMPFLLTAMKSCVVLALIATIVTEVVTGFRGIGFAIVSSLGAFQTVQGWLALLLVAAIGTTGYLLVDVLERVLIPWDVATRKGD